jgi:hypothetical protein
VRGRRVVAHRRDRPWYQGADARGEAVFAVRNELHFAARDGGLLHDVLARTCLDGTQPTSGKVVYFL